MNTAFWIVTILFMIVSLGMVLIILVQRPSGGGLAGAFGGAGGSGSDTVFGGRVGDALTWATVGAFVLYLGFAIALNLLDNVGPAVATTTTGSTATGSSTGQPVIINPEINPFGELEDFDIPPAEDPIDDTTEDLDDDNSDDEVDTTTEDPPNSTSGDD